MNISNIVLEPMTAEEVKTLCEEAELQANILAALNGFKSGYEMSCFKHDAAEGMIRFGGDFSRYLGYALAHADQSNSAKIIRAFYKVCEEHANLHRAFMEKRNREGIHEEKFNI